MTIPIIGFVGKRLKQARKLHGITQSRLGEMLGVTKQSISAYENYIHSPSPRIFELICEKLGLPESFFFLHHSASDFDSTLPERACPKIRKST